MNSIFFLAAFLLLLINLVINFKKMRKQPRPLRWMCQIAYFLSFCLFICIVFRIEIPMPTRFFINHVSPWLLSVIEH
jgi:hypothetical protein